MKKLWEYKTFTRDPSISFGAAGVLSVMTRAEYDVTGITLGRLRSLSAPGDRAEVMGLLTELVTAGYATQHAGPTKSAFRSVWRATDKAFRTTVEPLG